MPYDFHNLSDADFEDLARDLIGASLGVRFEAFGAGPDGGIDGRHAKAGQTVILQAKHYRKTAIAGLLASARKERAKIEALEPERYLFVTSKSLTPANKAKLQDALGDLITQPSDIIGCDDLNGLLRTHPSIEQSHIKLWLSQSAVFERILRSGIFNFTSGARQDIERKVRVYAQNPSFKEARDILEKRHVLIVAGPPGVGKTTLAEMLSYAYIGEEWQFVAIRSLDDGFSSLNDAKKQIFLFDDFLCRAALDVRGLTSRESQIAQFIRRVQNSKNARFILTTRSYILEQARQVSEQLADKRIDVTRYVLDVGQYGRRIRARILYNHLSVSGLPKSFIRALIRSKKIPKIVDHANYNPRIIEWMTDAIHMDGIEAKAYPKYFLDTLDHPDRIWDTAFRTHIQRRCQHLLFALFFASEFGVGINDLQTSYDPLHRHLCQQYGAEFGPKDFEEALRSLEGSFVKISFGQVSFINPCVKDFLNGYLSDKRLLLEMWPTVQTARNAEALLNKLEKCDDLINGDVWPLMNNLLPFARRIPTMPVYAPSHSYPQYLTTRDIGLPRRISLLQKFSRWFKNSDEFLDIAIAALGERGRLIESSDDIHELAEELHSLGYDDDPQLDRLKQAIVEHLQSRLREGLSIEDSNRVSEFVHERADRLPNEIVEATREAAKESVLNVYGEIAGTDSTSGLDEHETILEDLRARYGFSIASAMSAIEERRDQLSEWEAVDEPSFDGRDRSAKDKFEDDELNSLFATLLS